ncbi:hypothetical protein LOK49_LG11G00900 [Camellia lanceoleosa]|uniref:Uncharacterized protein n=1 Tax=Camellia lanceoleosa TaxID=1840588 RepID=A0ACC0FZ43_9ERIC|nr:hypothetical protein LOK49_LG11G00900 [Camellia lanceoleosa]
MRKRKRKMKMEECLRMTREGNEEEIAPVIHEWTYDAICHDLLNMEGNKYVHEVYGEYVSGSVNDEQMKNVVRNSCPGAGACGGMYTANTMASAIEAIGMSLPYREVMLEKQFTRHRVDRSICAWFWKQAISQGDSFKVPTFNSGSSNTQIDQCIVLVMQMGK